MFPVAAHLTSTSCALLSRLSQCAKMSGKCFKSTKVPLMEHLAESQGRTMEVSSIKPPRFRARQYAHNNRLQRKDNNFVLDFCQPTFLQGCHGKMQFLDVGCGTGDFTRDCLLPRCLPCRRIVATDWSRDMIEYAKEHSAHVKIDYQQLDISADITDFLRRNGQFHRIYSFYCLQWVKNQDVALKNIASLLTPGGECLLLFPASTQATVCWRLLAKMDRWEKYSERLLAYIAPSQDMDKQEQIDYMCSLLKDAGLLPSIFATPRMATFDGWREEDIIGLHMSIVPINQLVSDDERKQLHDDVRAIVRKLHGPETDQSRFRMYIIKASKSKG
ncbi:juvenile hormone acid O-methyltransferase [Rhipicephalus sanguineus]|nr:juvenile hormone acid O-methyltransferase [Rhipicephalus sanguineus]XP_049267507.1 juvenile hormone acid O-methyltransferase [Rhipicephalus sanguineus]